MNALMPRAPRRSPGRSVRVVREHPRFRAVENPAVAVTRRLRRHRRCVGSCFGLGQRERAEPFAARHRRQIPLTLRLGPVAQNHLRRERIVNAHRHRDRGVDRRDLLEGDQVSHRVEAEAVVLFRDHHAEKAQLGQLADDRRVHGRVAVPLMCVRRNLRVREVAGELLYLLLLLSEWNERP